MKKTTTIRRNAKRIKNLGQNAKAITVYSLSNGFVGSEIEADKVSDVAERIAADRDCRFSDRNGKVCAHIHSNLWYEIQD